ncbi:hypothetical protein [Nocardia brasiliensis]|uniref:hypothetical protein n=1 Tax=Nocardia brasiliensis TaxID=37326 RepID=UPI003D8C9EE9
MKVLGILGTPRFGSSLESTTQHLIQNGDLMRVSLVEIVTATASSALAAAGLILAAPSSDTQEPWTYTCDTLTTESTGNDRTPGATLDASGTGDCAAANGAPTTKGKIDDGFVLRDRDGSAIDCFGGTIDLPAKVTSSDCRAAQ